MALSKEETATSEAHGLAAKAVTAFGRDETVTGLVDNPDGIGIGPIGRKALFVIRPKPPAPGMCCSRG